MSKKEIIELHYYVKEGLPKTSVAEKLGINRRTGNRYLHNGKEESQYGPDHEGRPKRQGGHVPRSWD